MPTPKRELVPGEIYHIYNRGVGKKAIFHSDRDYNRFFMKMCEYKDKFPIDMLAYCLMPNHFHFLIRVPDPGIRPQGFREPLGSATHFLHRLFTAYSKYYCTRYADDHSGHVFQSRYNSKHVGDDSYYLRLCGYIHDNPVRKKLVKKPEEWPYSSYLALVGIRPDGFSCDAPELRGISHRQIYKEFAHNRNDSLDEIMKYI